MSKSADEIVSEIFSSLNEANNSIKTSSRNDSCDKISVDSASSSSSDDEIDKILDSLSTTVNDSDLDIENSSKNKHGKKYKKKSKKLKRHSNSKSHSKNRNCEIGDCDRSNISSHSVSSRKRKNLPDYVVENETLGKHKDESRFKIPDINSSCKSKDSEVSSEKTRKLERIRQNPDAVLCTSKECDVEEKKLKDSTLHSINTISNPSSEIKKTSKMKENNGLSTTDDSNSDMITEKETLDGRTSAYSMKEREGSVDSDRDSLRSKSKKKKKDRYRSKSRSFSPRSRSSSRSPSRKRRSRSRSRSYRRSSRSNSRSRRRDSRSTSRSRSHRHSSKYKKRRYKSRSRSRDRKSYRNYSRSRSSRYRRSRSPSVPDSKKSSLGRKFECDKLDQADENDSLRDKTTRKKLLDIARKNALHLAKNNCLPPGAESEAVSMTGKSVEELTRFCRKLASQNYSDDDLSDPSLSPDEKDKYESSTSNSTRHPFAIKDNKPIMMNIRNAPMLPLKSNAERLADASKLREQFPVSSGSDHRNVAENEWVPVQNEDGKSKEVKVFPDAKNVDITKLVSTRMSAMKKLQSNPNDRDAMKALTSAQKEMHSWALSKQTPGQFTGSTGAKILTPSELNSGFQTWAKKDQFKCTTPVNSHFGMKMMQKMGWNPGEGLGKNRTGTKEPLHLEFKNDKKGLFAASEAPPKKSSTSLAHGLAGKHPVTALVELCIKRGWKRPNFEVVYDVGPVHKKNFLLKCIVNNEEFKPAVGSSSKKVARANAAAVALQALGLMPSTLPDQSVAALSTSLNEMNQVGGNTAATPALNPPPLPPPFPKPRITPQGRHVNMQSFTRPEQQPYQVFDEYGSVRMVDNSMNALGQSGVVPQGGSYHQLNSDSSGNNMYPGAAAVAAPHQFSMQQQNDSMGMYSGGPVAPAPPPPPPNSDLPPPPPPGDGEPVTPPPPDQQNGANDPHSALAAQAALYAAASNAFYAKGSSYGYGDSSSSSSSADYGSQSMHHHQQYYGGNYSG